jgi:hypothetical protein
MKLKIVIEDMDQDGNDGVVGIHLEGDKERLNAIPDEELTAAEYWGMVLFQSCLLALRTGKQFEEFKNMKVEYKEQ